MKKLALFFLICFCFFCVLELVSYNFLYGHLRRFVPLITEELETNYHLYGTTPPNILDFEIVLPERNDETLSFDGDKKPLLVLGCSYAFGQGIDTDKIFSSQLQKKTKRKVLNVSSVGAGASECIRNLSYMEKHNLLQDNQFEYVIYIQMYDHIYRNYDLGILASYLFDIYKQNKNNSLKDKIKYYLNFSYTVKMINSKLHTENGSFEWRFDYFKYKISKMNEIIKRTLPNSKFVVLLYDDITNPSKESPVYNNDSFSFPLDKNNYPEQELSGIKFISTKDLVGDILYQEKYQIKNDKTQYLRPHHPNEKAWEIIVPALCKELNL